MSSIHYPKNKKSSSNAAKNVFSPPISYLHKYIHTHTYIYIYIYKTSIPSSKNINYVPQLIKVKLHKANIYFQALCNAHLHLTL